MTRNQSQLVLICSLLVVAAHTHCVLAHGAELLHEVAVVASDSAPLGPAQSCENESSCICKGVTLAKSTTMPTAENVAQLISTEPLLSRHLDLINEQFVDGHLPRKSLSAADARAFLQSFQI